MVVAGIQKGTPTRIRMGTVAGRGRGMARGVLTLAIMDTATMEVKREVGVRGGWNAVGWRGRGDNAGGWVGFVCEGGGGVAGADRVRRTDRLL